MYWFSLRRYSLHFLQTKRIISGLGEQPVTASTTSSIGKGIKVGRHTTSRKHHHWVCIYIYLRLTWNLRDLHPQAALVPADEFQPTSLDGLYLLRVDFVACHVNKDVKTFRKNRT